MVGRNDISGRYHLNRSGKEVYFADFSGVPNAVKIGMTAYEIVPPVAVHEKWQSGEGSVRIYRDGKLVDLENPVERDVAYLLVEAAEMYGKGSVSGEVLSRVARRLGDEGHPSEANIYAIECALKLLGVIGEDEGVELLEVGKDEEGNVVYVSHWGENVKLIKRIDPLRAYEEMKELGVPDVLAPGTYVSVDRDGSTVRVSGKRVRRYLSGDATKALEESYLFEYTLEVQ